MPSLVAADATARKNQSTNFLRCSVAGPCRNTCAIHTANFLLSSLYCGCCSSGQTLQSGFSNSFIRTCRVSTANTSVETLQTLAALYVLQRPAELALMRICPLLLVNIWQGCRHARARVEHLQCLMCGTASVRTRCAIPLCSPEVIPATHSFSRPFEAGFVGRPQGFNLQPALTRSKQNTVETRTMNRLSLPLLLNMQAASQIDL